MKRISIFFLLLLIVATAFALVSCGDDPHEHTYADEWTKTESEHYKAANCGCEYEFKEKGSHVDSGNDGLCDVCAYDYGHTHTYADEWTKTQTEHYKAVTCSHNVEPKDKASHKDTDNDGACDGCGYDFGHTHTYSVMWTVTATEHYKAASCSHDIAPTDKGEHKDENNDKVCDVCSYDYGHTHTYSNEWTKTESEHYKAVTCGCTVAPKDKAAHNDPENDGVCNTCSYGSDHVHEYSSEWSVSDTEHFKEASCGHTVAPTEKGAHEDENNDSVCDVCAFDYNHTHTYADTLTSTDPDGHYYAVTCGCSVEPKDKAAHEDKDGDCKCDGCDYETHVYSNEWCADDDGHYKAADCENEDHYTEVGEHKDEDGDCKCDTCLYVMHSHSDDWKVTETEHYKESSCGKDEHALDAGEHVDENDNGKCDVCDFAMPDDFDLPYVEWG